MPAKTRIKDTSQNIASREEAARVMGDLAKAANQRRILISAHDQQVLELKRKYESPLEKCGEEIERLTSSLRRWAESNPDEFPKDRKSIDLVAGVIGFRTGMPKLALASRAWTWTSVLAAMKTTMASFIRIKEEPDKEGLIAACVDPDFRDHALPIVGLKLVQDESFFAEPKLTDLDAS